jgi:hypothetical protein
MCRSQSGIVSVETALIFPVLLFILVMFFELARIALVIGVVNVSLERAVQNFRQDNNYLYALNDSRLSEVIKARVIDYSFDLVSDDNIELEVHSFSDLGAFTDEHNGKTSYSSEDKETGNYTSAPILNLSLTLRQNFITPLPELFDLGSSYQHEFQQILGDLVIDEDES